MKILISLGKLQALAATLLLSCGTLGCWDDSKEDSRCEKACSNVCPGDTPSVLLCTAVACGPAETPGCTEALEQTTCQEFTTRAPSWSDVCIPLCDQEYAECVGHILQGCLPVGDQHRSLQVSCEDACEAAGRIYTGVCSLTYSGHVSDSGREQCWCDEGD
jgi:hypothetical protein